MFVERGGGRGRVTSLLTHTRPNLHCPMLTPSSLSCTWPPCHVLRTRSRNGCHKPRCTLAHSPAHASHAVQSPLQLLVKPPPPTPPPHRCGMHALTCTTSATCTFPLFKHACPTSIQSPPLPAVTPTHPHSSLPLMFGEERAGAMACGHHAVCSPLPPPKHPPTTRECVF